MKKIFVGNLDLSVTEESLRALFSPYGTVESVHVVKDRDTGHPRGFAFVEMAEGDAEKAIAAVNGTNIAGRALKVDEARAREERVGPGAQGGFRGRGRGHRW